MLEKRINNIRDLKITNFIIWLGAAGFLYLFLNRMILIGNTESPVISGSPLLSVFASTAVSYVYFHFFILIKREVIGLILSGLALIILFLFICIPAFEKTIYFSCHLSVSLSFYLFLFLTREYFLIANKIKQVAEK